MDKANIAAIFPLTSAQAALHYHALREDGIDPGVIQVQFRIDGALDFGTFARAWNAVIDRFDALRLSVQMPEGHGAMLVIVRRAPLEPERIDLTALAGEDRDKARARIVAEDHAQPLDLARPPAMRLKVMRSGSQQHQVLWTCHHLFLDGWSSALVIDAVMSAYAALRRGQAPKQDLTPSYADYRGWLKKAPREASRSFWKDYFGGAIACRGDAKSLRAGQTGPGTCGEIVIPDALWQSIRRSAQTLRVTPAAIISSGWAATLGAVTGSDDIVFGVTTSGRSFDLPRREEMVGNFASVLPRRARLGASAGSVVQATHQDTFTTSPHELLPTDEILRLARAEGARGFDTLFVFENLPWKDVSLDVDGGLDLLEYHSDVATAFPLTVTFIPGRRLRMIYQTDGSLNDADLRALLDQFPDLLSRICAAPEAPLPRPVLPQRGTARVPEPTALTDPAVKRAKTGVQLEIARIWADILGMDAIGIEDDFVDLGGRSFDAIRVLNEIEARFGTRPALIEFIRKPTIAHLAHLVDARADEAPRWRTLVPVQPGGTRPPVMFFSVGGNHVIFLQPLAKRLGTDQPLFGFQPVGIDGEAEPFTRFEEIAALYVKELREVQPDGPYTLVGNCAGARLCLEVAHLLTKGGHRIDRFIVLDTHEPRVDHAEAIPEGVGNRVKLHLRKLKKGRIDKVAMTAARMLNRAIRERLVDLTGSETLRRRTIFERVERACRIGDLNYQGRFFDGTIWLLRASDLLHIPMDWSPFARKVEEIQLRLGHLDMFFEPAVDELADAISEILAGTQADEIRANLASLEDDPRSDGPTVPQEILTNS